MSALSGLTWSTTSVTSILFLQFHSFKFCCSYFCLLYYLFWLTFYYLNGDCFKVLVKHNYVVEKLTSCLFNFRLRPTWWLFEQVSTIALWIDCIYFCLVCLHLKLQLSLFSNIHSIYHLSLLFDCNYYSLKAVNFCFSFYSLLTFSWKPIVDYTDAQFESYLQEELKIKRSLDTYHDSRIHLCLYFIAPTGHS